MPRIIGKKVTNVITATVEFNTSTGDLSSDDEFQVEDEYGSLAQTPVSYTLLQPDEVVWKINNKTKLQNAERHRRFLDHAQCSTLKEQLQ